MDEWEINKPLGLCSGTGRKIEASEEYFGALVETEEGLQRRDFCADYWESGKPDVFCYWRSKLPLRKRRLKYDANRIEDGREIWRLRLVGGEPAGRRIEVVNPHLDEEQIEQLSSQIGQILQMDL